MTEPINFDDQLYTGEELASVYEKKQNISNHPSL